MRTRMIPLMGQSKALLRLQEGDGRGVAALSPPYPGGALYLIGPEAQALATALDETGQASLALPFSPVAALIYAEGGFPLSGGFAGRTDFLERAKVAVRLQRPAEKRIFPLAPPAPDVQDAADTVNASASTEVFAQVQERENRPKSSPLRQAGNASQRERGPAQQAGSQAQQAENQAQAAGNQVQDPGNAAQAAGNPAQLEEGPAQGQQAAAQQAARDRQPQSEALLDILKKAQELFHGEPPAASTRPVAPAPGPTSIPNPFPQAFPRSTWRRVSYPGGLGHYLSGEGTGRYGPYTVYALPGEYAPVPRRGKGFNKFLRATDGSGYWVRVVRKADPPKP